MTWGDLLCWLGFHKKGDRTSVLHIPDQTYTTAGGLIEIHQVGRTCHFYDCDRCNALVQYYPEQPNEILPRE
jgi:hypothetical protein